MEEIFPLSFWYSATSSTKVKKESAYTFNIKP